VADGDDVRWPLFPGALPSAGRTHSTRGDPAGAHGDRQGLAVLIGVSRGEIIDEASNVSQPPAYSATTLWSWRPVTRSPGRAT